MTTLNQTEIKTLSNYFGKQNLQELASELENDNLLDDLKRLKVTLEKASTYEIPFTYKLNTLANGARLIENIGSNIFPDTNEGTVFFLNNQLEAVDYKKISLNQSAKELATNLYHPLSNNIVLLTTQEMSNFQNVQFNLVAKNLGMAVKDTYMYKGTAEKGDIYSMQEQIVSTIYPSINATKEFKQRLFLTDNEENILKTHHLNQVSTLKNVNNTTNLFYHMKEGFKFLKHEEAYLITINKKNAVEDVVKIGQGNLKATITDEKKIQELCLKDEIKQLYMFHNHPDGSSRSSESDKLTTDRFKTMTRVFNKEFKGYVISHTGIRDIETNQIVDITTPKRPIRTIHYIKNTKSDFSR